MILADESPECRVALRYAALRAAHTGGRLTLLYVIEPAEFMHWASVAEKMQEDAREEAERLLYELAGEANKVSGGLLPELLIREGTAKEEVLSAAREDPTIRLLVLGAGVGREGPGPIVSALAKDIVSIYPIPVTIVPGNLTPDVVDLIA